MTILYVDDEPFMREVIQLGLRRAGFQVIVADGGLSALGILDRGEVTISVVMTDLGMPQMDGVQLAAAVKRRWPALPIIAFSGDPHRYLQSPSDSRWFTAVVLKGSSCQHLQDVVLATAATAASSFLDPVDHHFAGLEASGEVHSDRATKRDSRN